MEHCISLPGTDLRRRLLLGARQETEQVALDHARSGSGHGPLVDRNHCPSRLFHFFTTYSVTYGSVGAVMMLLTWFYIAGFALLIGGEVNAVIENAAAQQGDMEATAKGEKSPPTP